jgi:hypothetical protein
MTNQPEQQPNNAPTPSAYTNPSLAKIRVVKNLAGAR